MCHTAIVTRVTHHEADHLRIYTASSALSRDIISANADAAHSRTNELFRVVVRWRQTIGYLRIYPTPTYDLNSSAKDLRNSA